MARSRMAKLKSVAHPPFAFCSNLIAEIFPSASKTYFVINKIRMALSGYDLIIVPEKVYFTGLLVA